RGDRAPEDDLSLIELVAGVVSRGETRRLAHGTVDIDDDVARSADQVVMVVAHPILVPRRRARRLEAAYHSPVRERGQRVAHGLARDGADAVPHGDDDLVGGGVWTFR